MMDNRLRELVQYTKDSLGLETYELVETSIRAEKTFQGSEPILSMEWFPNGIKERTEDGSNPPGTAVIALNIKTKRFKSIIFVEGVTFANKLQFDVHHRAEIVRWIEQETGLQYNQRFKLHKQDDRSFYFHASVNDIPFAPSGNIEFALDERGRLVTFTMNGPFPAIDDVPQETFSLQFDQVVEQIAYQQFKRMKLPRRDKQQWQFIYVLEEAYIANDKQTVFSFELVRKNHIVIDHVLRWDKPLVEPFQEELLTFEQPNLTIDEALAMDTNHEIPEITEQDQVWIVEEVRTCLRKRYPDDSGDWVLQRIVHDEPYLIAELEKTREEETAFPRRLKVFIDFDRKKAVHVMDNDMFNHFFDHFSEPNDISIDKKSAFAKLIPHIKLSPIFVYDFHEKQWILCGKCDCPFGVLADSGELVHLDDI